MSFVSLVFGQGFAQSSVGAVTLDALLGETTELNSRATEYVVEDGPPVTDHIVQDSEQLHLSGWITSADLTLFGAQGRSKLVSAKAALRRIHAERLPVTVTTGLDVYVDMAMESCKIERTNEGEFFSVQCGFRKIRKVALRTADIPPAKVAVSAKGKAGQTKTNAGKADTPEATPKQQSDLYRILNR
ncbi:phage baseplate protein [Bordetella genomosp. 2]|uniref:Dit-like phage tail protein N-terminal domain-containing protein n=1 Tax=Bordetella genomosp. 2 TaxID=1983456 RepID=A0A261W1M5_9BORD|nr:hypothetical protein [Bordetella genomosp. 2]OZI79917.1 hypothetical protein CAL24_08385 [Bordetella genomosp. 2]